MRLPDTLADFNEGKGRNGKRGRGRETVAELVTISGSAHLCLVTSKRFSVPDSASVVTTGVYFLCCSYN